MTLYEQWQDLIDHQTDETFAAFWEKYSSTEKRIYSEILNQPNKKVTGTFKELAEKYDADPVIFMGFLDGVNTSLKKEQEFQGFDENLGDQGWTSIMRSCISTCWKRRPTTCTPCPSGTVSSPRKRDRKSQRLTKNPRPWSRIKNRAETTLAHAAAGKNIRSAAAQINKITTNARLSLCEGEAAFLLR